jgi:MSHA biogenesis protein MshP
MNPRPQAGFGGMAAFLVLVVLAAMAAGISSMATSQQDTIAADIRSGNALQAARMGNEFGLYRALSVQSSSATACDPVAIANASATLNLSATTGFYVTVVTTCSAFNDGESSPGVALVRNLYTITATACPSTTCPPAAAGDSTAPNYIERVRVVTAITP